MIEPVEDRGVEETALRAYVGLVPDPPPDHLARLRRDVLTRIAMSTVADPAAGRRVGGVSRRLVLTAGAVAVAAGAVTAIRTFRTPSTVDNARIVGAGGGQPGTPAASSLVLVPVAYQFDSGAAPAGAQLRALAGKLVDAPYDNRTGRYMYHHTKVWGDPLVTSPDGHYMSLASETKVWQAADGTGKQVTTHLGAQYPDQESQDYWQRRSQGNPPTAAGTGAPAAIPLPLGAAGVSAPDTIALPADDLAPLPSDRAGLAELLKVSFGAGAASKEVNTVYGRYVVPRKTRAEILRILADVPGFVWRGEVTDRAGRKGVAITFDDRAHDGQSLLIFHPNTGELLAHERLTLSPVRISAYKVILGTDWADRLG